MLDEVWSRLSSFLWLNPRNVCSTALILTTHLIVDSVITDPEDVRAFYHDAKDHSKANNIGFGEYIGR